MHPTIHQIRNDRHPSCTQHPPAGGKGCVDPDNLDTILGDYYPRASLLSSPVDAACVYVCVLIPLSTLPIRIKTTDIQWYQCKANGILEPITTSLASTLP